jgi:hypothetical protein
MIFIPAQTISFLIPRSDEQQGAVYTVQYAGCHTPIEDLGQTAPAMTGHSDEVRTFALSNAYDGLHDRAVDDVRPSLNTFLVKLSL